MRHRAVDSPPAVSGAYGGAGKRRLASPATSADRPAKHRAHHSAGDPLVRRRVPGALTIGGVVMLGLAVLGVGTSHSSSGAIRQASAALSPSIVQRTVPPSRSSDRVLPRRATWGTERKAERRRQALEFLNKQASDYAAELQSEQWVLPLTSYHLTGRFGDRSSLWATVHTGLDFAASTGTGIYAVAAGQVSEAGWAGSYGYRTIVTLADGTELWFCHQSDINVSVGESVDRGQLIGEVGSTGNVTGPHLHLEVRPGGGGPVDPAIALAEHGVTP